MGPSCPFVDVPPILLPVTKGKISRLLWKFHHRGCQWTTRIVVNNYTLCQNVKSATCVSPIEENVQYNITVQDVMTNNVNTTVILSIFIDDYVFKHASSVFCRIFKPTATGNVELHESNRTMILQSVETIKRTDFEILSTLQPLTFDTMTTNAERKPHIHLCLVALLVIAQTYLWQSTLGIELH